MAFTLEIHFEYLCAFAPPRPFIDPTRPQETWVVLRDLSMDEEEQHFARLLWDKQDLPLEHDDKVRDDGLEPVEGIESCAKTSRQHLTLDGCQIELWPDGKAIDLSPSLSIDGGTIGQLLAIEETNVPGLEEFDSELLRGEPSLRIAARIHLRTGTLSAALPTKHFFELVNNSTVVWEGKPARRVVYTLHHIQDYVDFRLTSFGSGETKTLRLHSQNTPGRLIVSLRNCEREETCEVTPPPYNDGRDGEINLFFPMSTAAAPDGRIALRRKTDGVSGVCAPKTFSKRST